jgi:hypothetical protein
MFSTIFKGLQTIFVNALLSLFWTYNYYSVVVEDRLKAFGINFKVTKPRLKAEPPLDQWSCTATIVNGDKLIEHYNYSDEDVPIDNNDTNALYLRKLKSGQRIARLSSLVQPCIEPNSTRFLNIMYFHHDMSDPIKLTLDPAYIQTGNEIFSKTFVFRLLNYQYSPDKYEFDDQYLLHIMDDKIKSFTIKSNQYLVFVEGGYVMKET